MLPNSYLDPLNEFSGRRPSVLPGEDVGERIGVKTKKKKKLNKSVCIVAVQASTSRSVQPEMWNNK